MAFVSAICGYRIAALLDRLGTLQAMELLQGDRRSEAPKNGRIWLENRKPLGIL